MIIIIIMIIKYLNIFSHNLFNLFIVILLSKVSRNVNLQGSGTGLRGYLGVRLAGCKRQCQLAG